MLKNLQTLNSVHFVPLVLIEVEKWVVNVVDGQLCIYIHWSENQTCAFMVYKACLLCYFKSRVILPEFHINQGTT